jgi:hypothetical protein
VAARQLLCLQPLLPQLQQLHITVAIGWNITGELFVLARWLKQHATSVTSLKLGYVYDGPRHDGIGASTWQAREASMKAVVEALQAAAATTAEHAAGPAAASLTAAGHLQTTGTAGCLAAGSLQLQSLDFCMMVPDEAAPVLLQALPASSLTHLQCRIDWGNYAHLGALCRLTALQSCLLLSCNDFRLGHNFHDNDLLAQLSTLQQLTRLQLYTRRLQLQQLPQLPRLRLLQVFVTMDLLAGQPQLQLGHLTSVTKLMVFDWDTPLLADDQLPPNLLEFVLLRNCSGTYEDESSHSLQPLLALDQRLIKFAEGKLQADCTTQQRRQQQA